eukprot:TRINITY_DN4287_c0_g1_i1.p1 TRINITY_DN4287_c0_g1~~TRINITY_DN4287_c0_g1_i1.p1  ORF type:complete len:328 (+),score=72.33 TRINITY_DN4287_c0_g1_i1:73-1056(+)
MDVPNTAIMPEEELQLALMNLQNYSPVMQQQAGDHGLGVKMEGVNSQMDIDPDQQLAGTDMSLQYTAILNQLSYPGQLQAQQYQMQMQQAQLQQAQLQQAQLQQAQMQQAQLQQAQLQQLLGGAPEVQANVPAPHPVEGAIKVPDNSIVPPPEFRQFVYAIAPPMYVYPSMYTPMMYPMLMHEPTFSMGVSSSPYHNGTPMKSRKIGSSKDSESSRKKQTRKTLWIPLSVENVFLNWFEKIGSTQYRCKRDACVGLIEAIADAGDVDDWIPEAQRAFNEDAKRKGRDLIWDKLNEMGKTFCDEKRTWSLTFSAAVLKYCLPKDNPHQ